MGFTGSLIATLIGGIIVSFVYGVFISHKENQIRELLKKNNLKEALDFLFRKVTYNDCELYIQQPVENVWQCILMTEEWAKWKRGTNILQNLPKNPEVGSEVAARWMLTGKEDTFVIEKYEPIRSFNLAQREFNIESVGENETLVHYSFIESHHTLRDVLSRRIEEMLGKDIGEIHIGEAEGFRKFVEEKYSNNSETDTDSINENRSITDTTPSFIKVIRGILSGNKGAKKT